MKKKCISCGIEKDIISFFKNKTYTSGYENKCKDCRRSQYLIRRKRKRLNNHNKEIAYTNKNEEFRNRDMVGEIWRNIPFANVYQASNLGRIRSMNRLSNDGRLLLSSIKSPSIHTSGYLRYTLTINGAHRSYYGHTLVTSAFLGIKPSGYDVDHIDRCRINNNISNLRYISEKENRGQMFNYNAKKYECK